MKTAVLFFVVTMAALLLINILLNNYFDWKALLIGCLFAAIFYSVWSKKIIDARKRKAESKANGLS